MNQEFKEQPVLVEQEEMKTSEIVETNGQKEAIIIGEKIDSALTLEDKIRNAEESVELYNRISSVSLKMTKEGDWVLQDGSPYLMESGAQKIANLWGIDISGKKVTEEWQEDEKGKYFIIIVSGVAYSKKLNRYIEEEGTCSQRDKFFGKVGTELKKLEDVDKTLIRKKAHTNLNNRLIKKMAGIAGVTVEDLKEAGLDISKITSFEYKKGTKKSSAQLTDRAKEKRTELWSWLGEITAGNEQEARAMLKKFSAFKGNDGSDKYVEDIDKLVSEKWIHGIHKKVKAEYDDVIGKFE